jgi:hypothetical protein
MPEGLLQRLASRLIAIYLPVRVEAPRADFALTALLEVRNWGFSREFGPLVFPGGTRTLPS